MIGNYGRKRRKATHKRHTNQWSGCANQLVQRLKSMDSDNF
jgi:hypothetical protein